MSTKQEAGCAPAVRQHAALYPRPLQPRKAERSERLACAAQLLAGATGGGGLAAYVLLKGGNTAIPELAGLLAQRWRPPDRTAAQYS